VNRSIRVVAAAALASVAFATGIGLALASDDGDESGKRAFAVLRDASGQQVGFAVFRERRGAIAVQAEVRQVAPGFHGFHVHAVGQCLPPYTSASGHYNPTGAAHGDHAGDLPTLLVNQDGTGRLEFDTDRFSVGDLFDADGSALILHAGRDNYSNIPTRYHSHTENTFGPDSETRATGDAGARAACGVVQRSGNRGDDDD
jgi:Cu-Zn family superoxide dismutase